MYEIVPVVKSEVRDDLQKWSDNLTSRFNVPSVPVPDRAVDLITQGLEGMNEVRRMLNEKEAKKAAAAPEQGLK